ncbi:GntR family transcriptional regulator, partial [Streptomyces sp. Act-28]
ATPSSTRSATRSGSATAASRRTRTPTTGSTTPAVLVTQVVRVGETPVLAAKHMLPTGAPALPVLQSN